MSETGYTSHSREEDGNQSDGTQVSIHQTVPKGRKTGIYANMHRWWISHWGDLNESAPLINRHRMTLEPPRKSTLRVAIEIISIVAIFGVLAAFIMLSVGIDDVGGKRKKNNERGAL